MSNCFGFLEFGDAILAVPFGYTKILCSFNIS